MAISCFCSVELRSHWSSAASFGMQKLSWIRKNAMMLFFIMMFMPPMMFAELVGETSVKCGACILLVNEFEKAIKAVDPKKTVTAGSYRVDPKGNQKGLVEIPYARSEVHLNEILEDVCDKSKQYTQAINPTTGKKTFAHEDLVVEYKRLGGKANKLHSACIDFIDDHEGDLLKFFLTATDDPVRAFCHIRMGVCTSVDTAAFEKFEPLEAESDNNENDEL